MFDKARESGAIYVQKSNILILKVDGKRTQVLKVLKLEVWQ